MPRLMTFASGAAFGAALVYFLDGQSGSGRRAVARDKAGSTRAQVAVPSRAPHRARPRRPRASLRAPSTPPPAATAPPPTTPRSRARSRPRSSAMPTRRRARSTCPLSTASWSCAASSTTATRSRRSRPRRARSPACATCATCCTCRAGAGQHRRHARHGGPASAPRSPRPRTRGRGRHPGRVQAAIGAGDEGLGVFACRSPSPR